VIRKHYESWGIVPSLQFVVVVEAIQKMLSHADFKLITFSGRKLDDPQYWAKM
jgi:hypothetical protein